MSTSVSQDIIVVGAGIAGLAAAHEFQKRGHNVEVYEASETIGGRGQILKRPRTDDFADVGTQYFHSDYKRALKLIDELGLTKDLKKLSNKSRFFTSPTESFTVSPSLPWMNAAGVRGNLASLIYVLKRVMKRKLDPYSHSHQPDWDELAALDSTDNKAVRDYIIRMLVLIGGLSEPDLSNVSTLQIVRLIRIILMTDYVTLKTGTASLHQALAKTLTVHTGTPIQSVVQCRQTGRVNGIKTASGQTVHADHVVIATPAPKTSALLPQDWNNERDYLDSINMPPAILVSLYLDRALEPGVWTYFMPLESRSTVRFCVDTHQKSPGNTPSGKATLQAWILAPESQDLIARSDSEIYDAAIADVSRFFPDLKNWVETYAITRHSMAVPQSHTGHNRATTEFLKRIDSRDGISFCGDYMSGGYVECALWSVERCLEKFEASQPFKVETPTVAVTAHAA